MIKKFFNRKNRSIQEINTHEADVALRLMFEIAISDGSLDSSELDLIKARASKVIAGDEKISSIIKKIIDETERSVSLYPTVKKINETHSKEEKLSLLKILWELVTADSRIDAYEENLFFKIAELIKIKRTIANQIKQSNS
ncbi:TerB family tellurite resistance protein [Gammaproteobacteria bacterium]|nr:TerB family tellurite resistance protein [Gammaproteobacteria bacterium]